MQKVNELKYIINQTINTMKNFTYDEVIELMSECLNNLEDRIEVDDCVELISYDFKIDVYNVVEVENASFSFSSLYDEIGIDFRDRLDDLIKYKSMSSTSYGSTDCSK